VDSVFDLSQGTPWHELLPCCCNRSQYRTLDGRDEVEIEPSSNGTESRTASREKAVRQPNQPDDEGKWENDPKEHTPDTQQEEEGHSISHATSVRMQNCRSAFRIGHSVCCERELDEERSRTSHPNTRSVGREVVSEVSGVRYAKSGDLSIAYQVVGDGPRDLIFVPGLISHVEFFHQLPGYTDFLNGLASFARVVVLDKRGNGLSDRVIGAASLEERMDDIRAVMDAVGSERATLFGVSEGGPISLLFAATYPARVESIVLYETFVRYGGVPGELETHEPDIHKEFTDWVRERYGSGESLVGFGNSRNEDPRVVTLWGQAERLSNSPGGFEAMYEALHETDVRAALPSVQAPCLVVHGATMSMFEQQNTYLAEHLPNARLVKLDGVDHFPWFAGSDRIVSEVEEFVTGTRSLMADERVLATLLFTDIVASTERAAAMGDRSWHEVIEGYYALVRRCLERFRGREVSTEGDGFIARFDGPARAVSCARAIRDGATGLGIEVRAGVHTGEIEIHGEEIHGLALHIGARVVALAESGEVLVSRTVKDLVVGSGIGFTDRGTHELKGVPDGWQLFAVSA
jgi:pimeloyl-ACP methyl ester carboxylesterase/class 3 adenylate cyclase